MKCLLLFLFLFGALHAGSQHLKKAIIRVDTSVHAETFTIPYSNIQVLDARFDRTSIGCVYNDPFLNRISFEKFDAFFPDSFHKYLPLFLKTFIKTDASTQDKLLILVKQFRIADHFLRGIESDPLEIELTLKISASFYAVHDNTYHKLFSVDNIMLQNVRKPHERKRSIEEGTRSMAMSIMLYKLLQDQKWELNTSAIPFSIGDIETGMNKRFDLAVYRSALQKGVYKNFNEFKNNAPSSTDQVFVYDKNENIDRLTDKEGKPFSMEGNWGICDGQKRYLYIRGHFSELIPFDKGFRVRSYVTEAELCGSRGSYDLLSATFGRLKAGSRLIQYFDIDMETGKLYLQEIFGKSSISFQ
jgi:hypothetical protein